MADSTSDEATESTLGALSPVLYAISHVLLYMNERGRPVSTGILRSSEHVELLESRKTFRKIATANQELALAA
jgi:hypothetical protein